MNRFTLLPRRPPANKRPAPAARPAVELLESRDLPNATPANVLVNNPTEDTTNQDTQSETAIVLGANSNVVVAYNDSSAFSFANPQSTGYSLSGNEGASFTDKGILPTNPYYDLGDPSLVRSSKTGTIILSDLTANTALVQEGERVNVFRSKDNGVSFSAPVNATPGLAGGMDHTDKPWVAVDNYPGPGYGNVYLAWADFLTNASGRYEKGVFLTRSTDDGLTWGPNSGVPITTRPDNNSNDAGSQGALVTVGPDQAVYVFYWSYGQGEAILMRKSIDQGQTFGAPVTVSALKTNGPLGDLGLKDSANRTFRTNAYPQAAVNPVTGDIYAVFDDDGQGSDRADIYFTQSSDGGNTWTIPLRVNDDATKNDQWQPALAVTPDGSRVGIFWYDRRLDPANNLIDRFGVIGTVSGQTVNFGANFRITDISFPPAFNQDPVWGNSGYMGDYDQATADNNYFYTSWGDNRLSDAFFANQPDVRFAKIPVTGLEWDTVLLATISAGGPRGGPAGPH
jgi:hypothetical protein